MRNHRLARLLAFPAVAVAAFVLLVALGWNGSSGAIIREQVEGPGKDPDLVFGGLNWMRSDEWMVITPLVVGQDSVGYPRVNDHALGGTDVSTFSAIPYHDWSTLFRPQYWGFGRLPLDQAFAFAWWFPGLVLALGCYALVLAFCPNRPGTAAAGAVAMFFAPFVQWWFLSITTGSLGWAAALVAAFVALDRARQRWVVAACVASIAFATAAFLLVLYPGFQVACAWVALACVVGWTFRAGADTPLDHRLRRLGLAAAGSAVGLAVFGLFLSTRWDVVQLQARSAYPGHRFVITGTGSFAWMFSGFLDGRLRADLNLPPTLGSNSSEASSFVFVGVFLAVPALWLLYRGWRERLGVDGLLVALFAVLGLFLAVLFVPGLNPLAKITGLSQAYPQRLFIGVGLLSLALVAATLREIDRQAVRPPWPVVAAAGLLTLAVHVHVGRVVEQVAPAFSGGAGRWLVLALVVTALVVAAARGHGAVALVGLAGLSVMAAARVNPVYDGVYDVRETAVGEAVADVNRSDPGGWISMGSPFTIPVLAEQPVVRYSGVALYPSFDAWSELDPAGQNRFVFNRYAKVTFTDRPDALSLDLPAADWISVRFDGCGAFAQRRLRHVLSDQPVTDPCLSLRRTVPTPETTYYIYDLAPA